MNTHPTTILYNDNNEAFISLNTGWQRIICTSSVPYKSNWANDWQADYNTAQWIAEDVQSGVYLPNGHLIRFMTSGNYQMIFVSSDRVHSVANVISARSVVVLE